MHSRMRHLFGPVPSRRLGISLGIDLVPFKTCSLDCVYCECGRTTCFTLERQEYVPTEAVLAELANFLAGNQQPDYITFSGSGEPTLHSGIGKIIDYLKKNYPKDKIALLTNGTLFHLPELREEIKPVDVVLPSLDAASEEVFRQINRPDPTLDFGTFLNGLIEFRQIYTGQIWLEIFIIPGINDKDSEIERFRKLLPRIKPDKVQLNTLDRPGTESWVRPAPRELLENIAARLEWPADIIASFRYEKILKTEAADTETQILQTIKRRPCTIDDLSTVLGFPPSEMNKYLKKLIQQRRIIAKELGRGIFYQLAQNNG